MEKLIKIQILSKQVDKPDGKGKFRTYFTPVNIVVKGEEDKGAQKKYLTVKFTEGVEHGHMIRGVLTCKEKEIWLPFVYEIKEENGEKVYPTVWVRGYQSFVQSKNENRNTCVPLIDEEDTNETEIK